MTSESVDFAVNRGVEGSSEWPNSLYQFAWFQDRDDKLQDLVDLAEPEEWGYDSIPGEHPYPYPVLFNYLDRTYLRLVEEGKISLTENGQFACFNVGLVTPNQEPIFASFDVNRREDAQR